MIKDLYDLNQIESLGENIQCQVAMGGDGKVYLVLLGRKEMRIPFEKPAAVQLGSLLVQAGMAV